MLSGPTLVVLFVAELYVAEQVVHWPVSRAEPSCYGCGGVLEVFLPFILQG